MNCIATDRRKRTVRNMSTFVHPFVFKKVKCKYFQTTLSCNIIIVFFSKSVALLFVDFYFFSQETVLLFYVIYFLKIVDYCFSLLFLFPRIVQFLSFFLSI